MSMSHCLVSARSAVAVGIVITLLGGSPPAASSAGRTGGAARDDDVRHGVFFLETFEHLIDREESVFEYIVQFVEEQHLVFFGPYQLQAFLPGASSRRFILLEVLRLPGESISDGIMFNEIAKTLQGFGLSRHPFSLHELNNGDFVAAAQGAENHPKTGGGFPLPISGIDDNKTFRDVFFDVFVNARSFIFFRFFHKRFELPITWLRNPWD